MQLERPSSSAEAVAALAGGRALAGGTELVPLLRDGIVSAETSRRRARGRAARDLGTHDRRRHDAGGARGLVGDPGGAARGVPAGRVAAAPEHGHDRRQPAPGDALLVLAAQVPLPAARRRHLPRARGPAPRARLLRRTTSAPRRTRPTRPRRCSRSTRASAPTGASSSSPSSTACRPRTTARRRRSRRTS